MPENSARHQIAGPVTSPLLYTPIPWVARQDEDGKWQKVPAIGYGWHYRDFAYGVPVIPFSEWGFEGYDRLGNEIWRDVQPGYVVSPRSGVIVWTRTGRGSSSGSPRSASSCRTPDPWSPPASRTACTACSTGAT